MGHLPSLHHQETRGSTPCSCIQVVSWNGRLELQGAGGTWIGVGYHFSMTPFWLCLISSWQEGCLGWSRTFFFYVNKIKLEYCIEMIVLPWGLRWQRICLQCKRPGFDPWVGKIPWRREWLPPPVFFAGEFHGQRRLAGYSPLVCEELGTTEWLTRT